MESGQEAATRRFLLNKLETEQIRDGVLGESGTLIRTPCPFTAEKKFNSFTVTS